MPLSGGRSTISRRLPNPISEGRGWTYHMKERNIFVASDGADRVVRLEALSHGISRDLSGNRGPGPHRRGVEDRPVQPDLSDPQRSCEGVFGEDQEYESRPAATSDADATLHRR